MNRMVPVVLAAGLVATWLGCQCATDSEGTTPTAGVRQADATNAILVALKVPNMTWAGCAASVRGALKKIAGVVDINTDPGKRVCSFKVIQPDVDYQAELAELAKTNPHLAGYEIQ